MARKRTKSIGDTVAQADRIQQLSDQLADRDGQQATRGIMDVNDYVRAYRQGAKRANDRGDRAYQTASKYIANIKGMRSMQNIRNKALTLPVSERQPFRDAVLNKQFARSTYMGNSKG